MVHKLDRMLEEIEAEIKIKTEEAFMAEEGNIILSAQEAYNAEIERKKAEIEASVREQYKVAKQYLHNLREEILAVPVGETCEMSDETPEVMEAPSLAGGPREVVL